MTTTGYPSVTRHTWLPTIPPKNSCLAVKIVRWTAPAFTLIRALKCRTTRPVTAYLPIPKTILPVCKLIPSISQETLQRIIKKLYHNSLTILKKRLRAKSNSAVIYYTETRLKWTSHLRDRDKMPKKLRCDTIVYSFRTKVSCKSILSRVCLVSSLHHRVQTTFM